MLDLKIVGGMIVDGTGAPAVLGDLGVKDGRIVAVRPGGGLDVEAAETINAIGLVVTPGFVDIHTHYDGQMTWDAVLEPSASHGVTTIVAGNCGVGFAPVRRGDEEWLVGLMEGVEDIPGTALYEGITWEWETFPEYLDVVERRPHAIDVATYMAHGPLRAYVMGTRGADNEPATAEDVAAMGRLVQDAVEAGALGFSTSRTEAHRTKSGDVVPGTFADNEELLAIAAAITNAGGGHFEAIPAGVPNGEFSFDELELLADLSRRTGVTTSFPVLQVPTDPVLWRKQLAFCNDVVSSGAHLVAQVAARPFGMLLGLPSYHAFQLRPTYLELANRLPFDELLAELRKPEVKTAILAEEDVRPNPAKQFARLAPFLQSVSDILYVLGNPPDYEPTSDRSVIAQAAAHGIAPVEFQYDLMTSGDGDAFLLLPSLNYVEQTHDAILEMMNHPASILGLSDGGAHCRLICDASFPTFLLTHWVRDRTRGARLPLEAAVKMQTADTASLVGLLDRGVLKEGLRADINVIDLARLTLHAPRHSDDLPAGGRRLLQDASGYIATIVNGVTIRRHDADTGARPGRLVRGPQR